MPYMDLQTDMKCGSVMNQQEQSGYTPVSNIHVNGEDFKLFQVFEQEFEQYYMAFSGFGSPLEIKSNKSLKSQEQSLRVNQQQENGFAQLSETQLNNENVSLFHVFEEEFKQYHVTFTGCLLPFSGVHFTFYKDFAERQLHILVLAMPLQRHILARRDFYINCLRLRRTKLAQTGSQLLC